jgi:hypothetical protein
MYQQRAKQLDCRGLRINSRLVSPWTVEFERFRGGKRGNTAAQGYSQVGVLPMGRQAARCAPQNAEARADLRSTAASCWTWLHPGDAGRPG